MSPQYHSASCSEYTGGERPLLFMVEDTGFVDLGGRAVKERWQNKAKDQDDSFLERDLLKIDLLWNVSSEVL